MKYEHGGVDVDGVVGLNLQQPDGSWVNVGIHYLELKDSLSFFQHLVTSAETQALRQVRKLQAKNELDNFNAIDGVVQK